LRDVREDVGAAQIVDEPMNIEALLAPSARRHDPGERRTTIVMAVSRTIVPVAEPSSASATSP
jgi:hypothetical protein